MKLAVGNRLGLDWTGLATQVDDEEDTEMNVQQLLEVKEEEVLHLWSSSLDQQDSELCHVKQEEEEQLHVKSEDDEKHQLIQLHQIKTEDNRETERPTSSSAEQIKSEPDGEDCGGPEPDNNQYPYTPLRPKTDEKFSNSSETEDSDDYNDDEEEEEEQLLMKSEDDEKHQVFQLHQTKPEDNRETKRLTSNSAEQMETEPDREDCGGPEPDRNQDPYTPLQPKTDEKASDSSETEDSDDYNDEEEEQLHVKSDDDEKHQLIQLHQTKPEDNRETERPITSSAEQMETEPDGEERGGPEPDRSQDPNTPLQPKTDEKASDSSETENGDDDEEEDEEEEEEEEEEMSASGSEAKDSDEDWSETRTPVSGVKNKVGHKSAKKSFSCSECCREFVSKSSLQRHVASRSAGCSSSLADKKRSGKKKNVNSHKVTAPKQRFSCVDCGKTFQIHSQFKYHMRIHTGEKPFTCDQCSKAFSILQSFKTHMMRHTGEKPFQCEVCDKQFYSKTGLKQHAVIHKGLKPFACGICGRCFRLRGDLNIHEISHKGVKPYICGDCGKKFSRQGSLNRHAKLHTEDRPFACDKCDKKFFRRPHLVSHVRIHKGDQEDKNENRPFACKKCKKRFLQKKHLKAHMLVHTGEKRFLCDICDAKFARPDGLKTHITKVHKK